MIGTPPRTRKQQAPGRLRELPAGVQQERAVVAVGLRLQRGQAAVLVVRGALDAGRHGPVGDARPRRHADGDAGLLRRLPRAGVDRERDGAGVVHVPVAGEIGGLPDVHVLARLVLPQDVQDRPLDLLARQGMLHPHEPHRAEEAVDVLLQPEDVELLVGRVPVGPEPFEDRPPVLDRGRLDVDPGVRVGDQLAVEIDMPIRRHRSPPFLARLGAGLTAGCGDPAGRATPRALRAG